MSKDFCCRAFMLHYSSNSVTKLLASTGATLGTFSVGVGPKGVAFDGANI
jgi:DNA-binding beta-propeller fold protein YncE